METWLCKQCGTRLDSSMRLCPSCGALNPNNAAVITEVAEQIIQEHKAVKKFSAGFSAVTLIIGIALFIVHIVFLVSGQPMYLAWQAFVGAVSGGLVAVFSIIGMVKNESIGKAVMIAGGLSLWMLFMYIIISF